MRSLITSFQAHVSQTATPAKTPSTAFASQGPLAERALLDDGPVHPDEADRRRNGQRNVPSQTDAHSGAMSEGERHGEARTDRKHGRNTAQKERDLRPYAVVSSKYKHPFDREEPSADLTTDLNSGVNTSYELDDVNDFVLPLHSSSPKKESVASSEVLSEYSQTFDRPLSPLSLSIQSDHSDVTSLLIDQSTSTGDTVISRDLLNAARSWQPTSSASSMTSSQRSSSLKSDIEPLPKKHSRPVPQNLKIRKRDIDTDSVRATTVHRKQEELTARISGERAFAISKMEPRYNEPLYNEVPAIITNDILQPARPKLE